ncbi:hypothetical protein ABM187_003655 [Stenotrophomonas maltophilia]
MNETPFTDEQQEELRRRILVAARDAGGMITTSQLCEALADVPDAERVYAMCVLQRQGELESAGTGGAAIHSLKRPGDTPVAAGQTAPFSIEGGVIKVTTPPEVQADSFTLTTEASQRGGQDDPLALRKRIETINQDIHEALVDACSIELPHLAIQHLLEADRATRAAAETVAR